MKIKSKSLKKSFHRSRSRSSSSDKEDPLDPQGSPGLEFHEFLKEIYRKFKRLSFKIIIAEKPANRLYAEYKEKGKKAVVSFAEETLLDFPLIKEAFINDLRADRRGKRNKDKKSNMIEEPAIVKIEAKITECKKEAMSDEKRKGKEKGRAEETTESNVELTDQENELENNINKKQIVKEIELKKESATECENKGEKCNKLPFNLAVKLEESQKSIALEREEVSIIKKEEFQAQSVVSNKPVELHEKTTSSTDLRSELILIFKKYDAYDEDPKSNFYDNIMSILRERGPHGLRECMKNFNRDKRDKILKDISNSQVLKSLWKSHPAKSPIKELLIKEFRKILKEPDIDKYGEGFEKNGLKGIEGMKKILTEKDWRKLLKLLKDERLIKSDQYRTFLEEKIIYFIDQKKISKKLGKSKGSLSREISKEIMEKGLDTAFNEREGRFFRKKLKEK